MATTAVFKEFGPFFNAGNLVGSALVYHYVVGTTTTKTCWTDRAKLTTAAQPLVADSNGLASAYFDGLYKIVVKTADGATTLATWDQVQISDPSGATVLSWSPVITCTTPGDLSVTYSSSVGTGVQIGRMVYATVVVQWSDLTYTTASGGVRIDLPVTSANNGNWHGPSIITGVLVASGITSTIAEVQGLTNYAIFPALQAAGAYWIPLTITDIQSGTNGSINFSLTYDAG